FVFSEKLRQWADVVAAGLIGIFVHLLLLQTANIRDAEWDILSASLFLLSFSLMRWSTVRRGLFSSSSELPMKDPLLENETGELTESSMHDDRLRTVGQMSARLVHELSHPIGALLLRVEEIKRNRFSEDRAAFEKSIASVERQLKHLIHMTDSVRMYASSGERTQNGFVPVPEIFRMTMDMCEVFLNGKGVRVYWPDEVPAIEIAGGPTLQIQVMVNLVKNAVDAVADLPDQNQRWVRIDIKEQGGSVEFAVSNGGPAVSKFIQSNLFKPFFTTKKTGRGMGLGLALCRELVQTVGGEIWYDETARTPRFVVRYSFLPHVDQSDVGDESNEGAERFNKSSAA
ncbi:sensor histidine kinase, partial [bacterium]|nr:sensor histidine kinase [bacterium]